jgi:hypothetical protein
MAGMSLSPEAGDEVSQFKRDEVMLSITQIISLSIKRFKKLVERIVLMYRPQQLICDI